MTVGAPAVGETPEAGATTARAAEVETPVLWHLKVSHYNEKVRWALDYKGIPHRRRAVMPGRHREIAEKLTGGSTFPVLELDGKAIGDSTEIIAALERRHPEPPLYPADPAARERALEIEDFFDEQLGPHTRLLAIHYMLPDPKLMLGAFTPDLRGVRRLSARLMYPLIRRRTVSDFGIDDRRVALAHDQLRVAGRRFNAELQASGYLVGETFTVADLTLASLLAPLAAPEQFPYPQPQRGDSRFEEARDALARSGLLGWTREIYARHRGRSAEIRG
jgi:glutathione S-transferase